MSRSSGKSIQTVTTSTIYGGGTPLGVSRNRALMLQGMHRLFMAEYDLALWDEFSETEYEKEEREAKEFIDKVKRRYKIGQTKPTRVEQTQRELSHITFYQRGKKNGTFSNRPTKRTKSARHQADRLKNTVERS